MTRWSLYDLMWMHWFIGVGVAVAYAFYCQRKSKARRLMRFGGDGFSLGTQAAWMRWFVAAYLFEAATSFLVGDLYRELALSAFEAAALTLGLFMVDRAAGFIEEMPDAAAADHVAWGDKLRAAWSHQWSKKADADAARGAKDREERAERERRFNDATRGR